MFGRFAAEISPCANTRWSLCYDCVPVSHPTKTLFIPVTPGKATLNDCVAAYLDKQLKAGLQEGVNEIRMWSKNLRLNSYKQKYDKVRTFIGFYQKAGL